MSNIVLCCRDEFGFEDKYRMAIINCTLIE